MSKFLTEWKKTNGKFIKPKLHWYFGPWWKEGNLPVWRRGNIIRFGKNHYVGKGDDKTYVKEYETTYDFAKLVKPEWTPEGKKNHPILSRFLKPVYELPNWLSFYFFNADIMYKTKWSDDDYRYEYPAHITLVFFGLALSVTAYIPKADENDWTCQDDYWESLLTYNHYEGDLKKTNEVMGWWNKPGDKNFRFRFQPRFLTSTVDRDDLVAIQAEQLERLKGGEDSDYEMDEE
jgi:hypothetical protein